MIAQFMFTMTKVSKKAPGGKDILKDVSISFYPGAKIGVVGTNGSGRRRFYQGAHFSCRIGCFVAHLAPKVGIPYCPFAAGYVSVSLNP